ncbi:MAG: hypothetical protein NXI32_09210 [bacterium]|nr:hypothetical protein [bacterium]
MNCKSMILGAAVLAFCSTLQAQDLAKSWIKYFEGNWERESTYTTIRDGEETVEKDELEWTATISAGGMAGYTEGKHQNGTFSSSYMRWDGNAEILTEYGNGSDGWSWSIEFRDVDDKKLEGTITASGPAGKAAGTIVIKKTSENSYQTDWSMKLYGGGEMTGLELNARK